MFQIRKIPVKYPKFYAPNQENDTLKPGLKSGFKPSSSPAVFFHNVAMHGKVNDPAEMII